MKVENSCRNFRQNRIAANARIWANSCGYRHLLILKQKLAIEC